MEIKQDKKSTNLREFSRVDAHIPLQARLVPKEEQQNIQSKISGEAIMSEFRTLTDVENKVLSDWLKMLNAKLDTIINILTFQREGFSALPFLKVNISGAGLRFPSPEKYSRGDIIELKMLLPMMPPIALYVYGEVIEVESIISGFETAVKFIAMDEDIRDEIVKFVFQKQREMLRQKRDQASC
jgi:hypothetical protein